MIAGRPEHREYTIGDTIYYAVGARLFYETDDRHDLEEIDDCGWGLEPDGDTA